MLVGHFGDESQVLEAISADNRSDEHRERRYTIEAETLLRITRDAEADGLDVIGFYHSHPDHPARPSQTDLDEATFPSYVYLIQSVRNREPAELTAWTLAPDRSKFQEQPIRTAITVNEIEQRESR